MPGAAGSGLDNAFASKLADALDLGGGQAEQPTFEMDREGRPWLVETRGPARIIARVENRGSQVVTLGGTSFDRELPPVSVPPGGTVEIPLPPAPVIRLVRHPIVQWRPAVLADGETSPHLTCRWIVTPD